MSAPTPTARLRDASAPPRGWSVNLIEQPARASMICIERTHGAGTCGGITVLHHLLLGEARALSRYLRNAIRAQHAAAAAAVPPRPGNDWHCTASYPWNVSARLRHRNPAITFDGWLGEYPGNRISASHRLSVSDATRLADAIDECLALHDTPPPCELPRDVDPNPERAIPPYLRLTETAHAN